VKLTGTSKIELWKAVRLLGTAVGGTAVGGMAVGACVAVTAGAQDESSTLTNINTETSNLRGSFFILWLLFLNKRLPSGVCSND